MGIHGKIKISRKMTRKDGKAKYTLYWGHRLSHTIKNGKETKSEQKIRLIRKNPVKK